jgi:hypothetical protein
MAIVKRKNPKTGKSYYFNTVTKKFASEEAYKRSKSAPIAKFKARKGGKPSMATCSTAGRELKVRNTSSSGKTLRRCR